MTIGQRFLMAVSSGPSYCLAGMLALTVVASAQDSSQQPHPWRRAADAPSEQVQQQGSPDQIPQTQGLQSQGSQDRRDQAPAPPLPPPPPPNFSANRGYGAQSGPGAAAQPYPAQQFPAPNVPATLTIRPGTYLTVHVDQWLSSDKNQHGDTFFASLAEPLVVDGVVVAQRGQTVRGRVTEAQKAGRVEGTSKLGVELTGLTLVDGQQTGIHSRMVMRNGQTSVGRDAGAIAGATALGAVVGAGADYGRGAAIGAGAGAAAGIIGVLLTRGRPTLISPESMLTFELEGPVSVDTDHAPQAFRYAQSGDYGHGYSREPAPQAVGPRPAYYPPYYYSPYYGPGYSSYYWGPGVSFYIGPRYSYGGYYYRGSRGFRR